MQATGTERDALDAVTARFFKGLGDVNRLKILEFLKGCEKAVGAIVEHVGLPQNQGRCTCAVCDGAATSTHGAMAAMCCTAWETQGSSGYRVGPRHSSGQRGSYHGLRRYRRM